MKSLIARLIRDDEGQDLIEYGLLVGIITTVVVGAISTIGGKVDEFFSGLVTALESAGTPE